MSKHTPGPWEWGWRPGDEVNPGSVVAVGPPHHPHRPYSVAMCPRYRGPDASEANRWDADARLIAAAPDLLGALERLTFLVHGDYGGPIDAARRNARAAIAKATGGTNKIVEVDDE